MAPIALVAFPRRPSSHIANHVAYTSGYPTLWLVAMSAHMVSPQAS